MEINNFFSKPDLGNVDPEVFRKELELINLKNKILEFRGILNKTLRQYKGFYTKEKGIGRTEELEDILTLVDFHFGIKDGKI